MLAASPDCAAALVEHQCLPRLLSYAFVDVLGLVPSDFMHQADGAKSAPREFYLSARLKALDVIYTCISHGDSFKVSSISLLLIFFSYGSCLSFQLAVRRLQGTQLLLQIVKHFGSFSLCLSFC
jgi:hypothetical protein